MSTGILGILNGAASLTYTPTVNAQVLVTASGSGVGGVGINGIAGVFAGQGQTLKMYVGANQTLTVSSAVNCVAVISTLEEDPQ